MMGVGMTLYILPGVGILRGHMAESLKRVAPKKAVTRWGLVFTVRLSLVASYRSTQPQK
jgi:hypothetical protein